MTNYTLWRGATESLTDIYVYTFEMWGEVQANKYLDGFYICFERIVQKQEARRLIPAEFGVDGYFTKYEKHYIYWKELSDGQIAIVAILHERMHRIDRLKDAY